MPTTTVIGERIRQRRLARNLTLREVGDKAKVSATHLSEIERGKTSPTVGALVRIARALGEEPARLVAGDGAPGVAVVRRGERARWTCGAVALQVLTRPVPPHELALVEVDPGPDGILATGALAVRGEVLVMVLRGVVEVVQNGERRSLHEGDVLHFAADGGYDLRAANGASARCIVVFSPSPTV